MHWFLALVQVWWWAWRPRPGFLGRVQPRAGRVVRQGGLRRLPVRARQLWAQQPVTCQCMLLRCLSLCSAAGCPAALPVWFA